MAKSRILVVEDDNDISNMLRIYFTGQGLRGHRRTPVAVMHWMSHDNNYLT